MWESASQSLLSFWEALKAAEAPLQAAVVAASVAVLVALTNIWLQLRQQTLQKTLQNEQQTLQTTLQTNQQALQKDLQDHQQKLSEQLETFRLTASEKSRWLDDRRRVAFEKLEGIRKSLADAVSRFERLAKGSDVWDDHEMVERAPDALLSLGTYLSALSKGKQDIARDFVPVCEDARNLFTETFLLLSVHLETRKKRRTEIESRVKKLVDARDRFEDLFKRYERDPWDWASANDSGEPKQSEA